MSMCSTQELPGVPGAWASDQGGNDSQHSHTLAEPFHQLDDSQNSQLDALILTLPSQWTCSADPMETEPTIPTPVFHGSDDSDLGLQFDGLMSLTNPGSEPELNDCNLGDGMEIEAAAAAGLVFSDVFSDVGPDAKTDASMPHSVPEQQKGADVGPDAKTDASMPHSVPEQPKGADAQPKLAVAAVAEPGPEVAAASTRKQTNDKKKVVKPVPKPPKPLASASTSTSTRARKTIMKK